MNQTMFEYLWPTPVSYSMWDDYENYNDIVKELIYEDSQKYDSDFATNIATRIKQNMKESSLNFFSEYQSDYRITLLRGWLENRVLQYFNHLKQNFNTIFDNQTKEVEYSVVFKDSWYHITKDRGYHDVHNHGNSSICGIFYVDIGDSSIENSNGVNRFRSPVYPISDDLDKGYSWFPSDVIDIVPENGKLILFPGYLLHSATPYCGDKDRIVIAFNTQIHKKSEFEKPTLSGLFDIFDTIGNQEENLLDENSNRSI
jgi:uncharacterized protein (TIGR02466 family)